MGQDSSVGIANRYGLDGRGIESRYGRDLPHPSRLALGPTQTSIQWVPGLYNGYRVFTMGTGSFPEVKRPGRGVDHPPPSSAEVKERVAAYLHSLYWPSWPVLE